MKIDNQVATVEQCQKLEALGIEYNRPAYHWIFDSGMRWKLHPLDYYNLHEEGIEYHPAFTVAELGVMLPEYIKEDEWNDWFLEMYKDMSNLNDKEWFLVRYTKHDGLGNKNNIIGFNMNTEAQARAAMLIYLLENNYITASEVNQRLHQ